MIRNRAEYMREYRAKRKAQNDPVPRGGKSANGRHITKFERAQFIAWDGEGITTDCRIDDSTFQHHFVLFGNSLGESITDNNGLASKTCFDFMLKCAADNPLAIHVIYGGSYDMNQMLRDLPRKKAEEIAKTGQTNWRGYYLRFHPRRSLTIKKKNRSIVLWDVVGFFQMKFEKAVVQWLGKDYDGLELISAGKEKRTAFSSQDMDFMQRYNSAELHALVLLMEQFHNAVKSVGLKLSRWDGAGSIASAVLQRQKFKEHLSTHTPKAVELAARHAYFGGRFELGQYGIHEGLCYGYDINSAYPSVFRAMPSLAKGIWYPVNNVSNYWNYRLDNFSLVRVKWNLPGIRYGPFPYRNKNGLVLYPIRGENWVWGSEFNALLDTVPDRPDWDLEVLEAWAFAPDSDELPFQWVEDYYQTRQQVVNGESDLPYGSQMILKLGLNSLYGKTAQSLGYTPESRKLPPFHSLLYAGYITSSTRAMLWKAAMQAPDNVVMLATDGIITTAELNVPISTSKELGFWERTEYDFCCAIQSGVYITGYDKSYKFKKRGLDSDDDIEVFLEQVRNHWQDSATSYTKLPVPQTRLIGIKTACISDDFWNRWGCWYNHNHELLMHPGPKTKRLPDKKSPNKEPDKGLVMTIPMHNLLYDIGKVMSTPYERPWDREKWAWGDDEELHELTDFLYQ